MDAKRFLFVGLCALAMFGCKGKSGVVGEWHGSQPSPTGTVSDVTAKFNADSTYSFVLGSGSMNAELDGTYTYDDVTKQLTVTQTGMKVGGQDVKVTGGTMNQAGQAVRVTFTDADNMTIKMPGGDMNLKRKS